jgi:hypothetical protein
MEFIVNAVVLSTDRTRSGVRKAKKSFDRLPDQIKFTALLTKDVFQTVATGFRVRMGWGLGRLWRISTNYFSPIKRVKGIEPSCPAWEAGVLPLNYTRKEVRN